MRLLCETRGNKCHPRGIRHRTRHFESVFNFSIEVVLCHLSWSRNPEQATTGTSEHFLQHSFLSVQPFRSSLDIASQLVTVRAELSALQDRYDALHADRDRLAHLLEENMRKYKRFKRWVFVTKLKVPPKADKDRVDATPLPQSQPTIKMLETPITHRSMFAHLHWDVDADSFQNHPARYDQVVNAPRPNLSLVRGVPCHPAKASSTLPSTSQSYNTCTSASIYVYDRKRRVPSVSEGSPSTRRLKRTRDENDSVETVEDTSQTQDDSQGSYCSLLHQPDLTPAPSSHSAYILEPLHAFPARPYHHHHHHHQTPTNLMPIHPPSRPHTADQAPAARARRTPSAPGVYIIRLRLRPNITIQTRAGCFSSCDQRGVRD
jgi:hypothetical protein